MRGYRTALAIGGSSSIGLVLSRSEPTVRRNVRPVVPRVDSEGPDDDDDDERVRIVAVCDEDGSGGIAPVRCEARIVDAIGSRGKHFRRGPVDAVR